MTVTLTAPEVRSVWIGSKRALPAVALAGACALAALSPVGADEGQVLCPYRLATGGWCPGCGCTRALSAAMRADIGASIALNPLTLLILAQATLISGWFLATPTSARSWWQRNDTRVLQVNLVLAALLWIMRMSTGAIPLPF